MGKFFRHFKGKPYRFLDTAKFSENLEEMVVYETMYDNPEGKLWVRPRKMFEENVERDGRKLKRFTEVPYQWTATPVVDDQVMKAIGALAGKILDGISADHIAKRLAGRKGVLIQTCTIEDRIAGFKIGYEESGKKYYSWLGGVDPEFHRLGVASGLLKRQHDWCKGQGYSQVETRTTNDHTPMLMLNIRSGFRIAGTFVDSEGVLKIILHKNI